MARTEEQFFDERPEWYATTRREYVSDNESDHHNYVPQPSELYRRAQALQWLKTQGFTARVTGLILQAECLEVARRLLHRVGVKEANKRLRAFLII